MMTLCHENTTVKIFWMIPRTSETRGSVEFDEAINKFLFLSVSFENSLYAYSGLIWNLDCFMRELHSSGPIGKGFYKSVCEVCFELSCLFICVIIEMS